MTAESPPISFGLWNPPGAPFRIKYSLPLLREIDFFVGDGYRRIPHGGLEVGGLLYGTEEPEGLTLIAYQAIECQHQLGPSFVLSEADVEALKTQTAKPFHHESHGDLALAGWFISHGRSDLKLTERELELFDDLFPGPRRVTMLVKPEKFKPTRYGFLVRPRRSRLTDRVCHHTFLLPLTAKSGDQIVGEDPAAVRSLPSSRSGAESQLAPDSVKPADLPEIAIDADSPAAASPPAPAIEPIAAVQAPPAVVAKAVPAEAPATAPPPVMRADVTAAPEIPAKVAKPETIPVLTPAGEDDFVPFSGRRRHESKPEKGGDGLNAIPRWVEIALGAAILLLSLAGVWWTYLNFLLPPIPLRVEVINGSAAIVWPPEVTSGTAAVLTVWTAGQPSERALTEEERQSGFVAFHDASADSTVQLRSIHWAYVRSGQIRLIQVPPAPPRSPPAHDVAPKPLRRRFDSSATSPR